MRSRDRLVALVCMVAVVANGCWSITDASSIALASAFGVDAGVGPGLMLAVELVNPKMAGGLLGGAGAAQNPTRVLYSVANSVFEALGVLDTNIGKQIFLGESEAVLIGKRLATAGVTPALDFVTRQHQLRRTIFVIVADSDVPRTLSTPVIRDTAAEELRGLLDNGRFTGQTAAITANTFLSDLALPGIEPVAPVVSLVELPQARSVERTGLSAATQGSKGGREGREHVEGEGEKRPEVMQMNKMAVFKHDKLVGILTPAESRGLLWLRGRVSGTVINIPALTGGGFTMVELVRTRTSVTAKIGKDGSIGFQVKIESTGEVADVPVLAENVASLARVREIESQVAQVIEAEVVACLSRLQGESGTDSVGLGLLVYRQNPDLWRGIGEGWDEVFRTVPVAVEAKVKTRSTGTTFSGITPRKQVPD